MHDVAKYRYVHITRDTRLVEQNIPRERIRSISYWRDSSANDRRVDAAAGDSR